MNRGFKPVRGALASYEKGPPDHKPSYFMHKGGRMKDVQIGFFEDLVAAEGVKRRAATSMSDFGGGH